jgi:hypothetical protein
VGDKLCAVWNLIIHQLIALLNELCLSLFRLAMPNGAGTIGFDRYFFFLAQYLISKISNDSNYYGPIIRQQK